MQRVGFNIRELYIDRGYINAAPLAEDEVDKELERRGLISRLQF